MTDAQRILAAAEEGVLRERQAQLDYLDLLLEWADLHSLDPQSCRLRSPSDRGGDRLLRIGGDGTPEVADLCFAEMAVARQKGMIASRNATASVLDLAHRMRLTWAAVQRLACDAWVARKVASMSATWTATR